MGGSDQKDKFMTLKDSPFKKKSVVTQKQQVLAEFLKNPKSVPN